jgi:hypothetical protein
MMRISVYEVLTTMCGWSDLEARERGKNVSHYYDNHIRMTKAPKDSQGIAIYDESDVAGLIEAAHNLRNGKTSNNSYDKPTKYVGSTMEDMGF